MISSAIINTTLGDDCAVFISSGLVSSKIFIRRVMALNAINKFRSKDEVVSISTKQLVDPATDVCAFLYTNIVPMNKYVLSLSVSANSQQKTWDVAEKIIESHSKYFVRAMMFMYGNSKMFDIYTKYKKEAVVIKIVEQMQIDIDLFTNKLINIVTQMTQNDNSLLSVENLLPSCLRRAPVESSALLGYYSPGIIEAINELYPTYIEPNGFFSVSEIPVSSVILKHGSEQVPPLGVVEFAHFAEYILRLRNVIDPKGSANVEPQLDHIVLYSGLSFDGPTDTNRNKFDVSIKLRCYIPVEMPTHGGTEEVLFPLGGLRTDMTLEEAFEHNTILPGVIYYTTMNSLFPVSVCHVGAETTPIQLTLNGLERVMLNINGCVGNEGTMVESTLRKLLLSIPFVLDKSVDYGKSRISWLNSRPVPNGMATLYKGAPKRGSGKKRGGPSGGGVAESGIHAGARNADGDGDEGKEGDSEGDGESRRDSHLAPQKGEGVKMRTKDRGCHIDKQSEVLCITSIKGPSQGDCMCVRTNSCPVATEIVPALSVLLKGENSCCVYMATKNTRVAAVGGPNGGAYSVYGKSGVPDMWRVLGTTFGF